MFLSALSVCLAAAFPVPQGYVNDAAAILDPQTRAELTARLREIERQTTAEIAVVTVASLDGLTVEDYANRLFKAWGIGKRGRNNGVLILVAPAERKMRIEVGYGLEPVLPDGLAGQIIRDACLPRFRKNDYAGGIREAVGRISAVVVANHVLTDGERRALSASPRPPAWITVPFFACFVAIGFFAIGLGFRLKVVGALIFGAMFGGTGLLMGIIPAFNAAPPFQLALAAAMAVWGYRKGANPGWIERLRLPPDEVRLPGQWVTGVPDSQGSDGSSSGSSGGDFGGGSSGGGGASGSW